MVRISAKTMYTASCIDAAASALRSPGGAGRSRGPGRMPATTYGRRISRAGSGWRTAIPAVHSPFRTIEARYDSSSYRKAVNCVPMSVHRLYTMLLLPLQSVQRLLSLIGLYEPFRGLQGILLRGQLERDGRLFALRLDEHALLVLPSHAGDDGKVELRQPEAERAALLGRCRGCRARWRGRATAQWR